jgi:cellulose synthase/poly-beta-1,6-N-acetylglucosamine synthase-like glycosyltransferase
MISRRYEKAIEDRMSTLTHWTPEKFNILLEAAHFRTLVPSRCCCKRRNVHCLSNVRLGWVLTLGWGFPNCGAPRGIYKHCFSVNLYVLFFQTPAELLEQRLRWSRGCVLASSTQVRGFKPGRSRRIFQGEKIPNTPSFGGEVKPAVPCRRFVACKRSLNVTWNSAFRRNSRLLFLAQ